MARLLIYVLNLVFVVLIGWIVTRIVHQFLGHPQQPRAGRPGAPRTDARRTLHGETARDPVCGMFVSTELSHRLERGGQTLHFCSQDCLKRYQSEARHSNTLPGNVG